MREIQEYVRCTSHRDIAVTLLVVCLISLSMTSIVVAAAPTVDVSSDGSDGDLIVLETDIDLVDDPVINDGKLLEIDLAQAVRGVWSDDNQGADIGKGVYDADKWAVTFEYASVHIGPNVRVEFKNHPSYCPVVWLVRDDCRIDGIVDVSGKSAVAGTRVRGEPGPGGFFGGIGLGGNSRWKYSGGMGPGGGAWQYPGHEHLTRGGGGAILTTDQSGLATPYGNDLLIPLIGGSGGTGSGIIHSLGGQPGSGGGGAILIAVGEILTVDGTILARSGLPSISGWSSTGAAGSIRLVARLFEGNGFLDAREASRGWWNGSDGRIRVESVEMLTFPFNGSNPTFSWETLATPVILWPPANAPKVTITLVTGQDMDDYIVPAEPPAAMDINADLQIQTAEHRNRRDRRHERAVRFCGHPARDTDQHPRPPRPRDSRVQRRELVPVGSDVPAASGRVIGTSPRQAAGVSAMHAPAGSLHALIAFALVAATPFANAQVVVKEAHSQEFTVYNRLTSDSQPPRQIETSSQDFTIYNRLTSEGPDSIADQMKEASSQEFTISGPLPDVIVTGVTMSPPDALPGDDFTVAWSVTNLGPGRMQGSWVDTVYYSTDDIVGNDTKLGEVPHYGSELLPGESANLQTAFVLPSVDGAYFIVVTTNFPGLVSESNGVNNTALSVDPIHVQPFQPPDLTVTEIISPPAEVLSGSTTQISFVVRNISLSNATYVSSWTDSVFLSSTATLPVSLAPSGNPRNGLPK